MINPSEISSSICVDVVGGNSKLTEIVARSQMPLNQPMQEMPQAGPNLGTNPNAMFQSQRPMPPVQPVSSQSRKSKLPLIIIGIIILLVIAGVAFFVISKKNTSTNKSSNSSALVPTSKSSSASSSSSQSSSTTTTTKTACDLFTLSDAINILGSGTENTSPKESTGKNGAGVYYSDCNYLDPSQITTESLEATAVSDGMLTMLQDGILKACAGITSLEEVYRVVA